MRTRPAVSVVIPAYNAAPWLKTSLDSVLAQTAPVHEVLVVDDGSSDGTAQIALGYGGPVKLLQGSHRGIPQRNLGVAHSVGDFVAFLDADDFWDPVKIERQLGLIEAEGTEWAICQAWWLDDATGDVRLPPGDGIPRGDILESLFLENFIVASTTLVSRAALTAVGPFEETDEVVVGEDWDLWLRLAERYPLSRVEAPLATLRLHPASMMSSMSVKQRIRNHSNVIERAVGRNPQRLGRLRRRALANLCHSAGVRLFRQGQVHLSRPYFIKSWVWSPIRLESLGYAAMSFMGTSAASALMALKRSLRRRVQ